MASATPAPEDELRSLPQRVKPSARGRALIFTVFVLVMAVACWLPVIGFDGPIRFWRGIEALVLGPFGLRYGHYAWLANVMGLLALDRVLKGSRGVAVLLTVIALILAMDAWMMVGETVPVSRDGKDTAKVTALLPGYYVWLAGLTLPWLCSLLLKPPMRARGDFSA